METELAKMKITVESEGKRERACKRLAFGFLVLSGFMVVASVSAGKTAELTPIEVRTAVVETEKTTRFGGTVAVVGRDQILALNADGMAEALRRVTGVSISRFNKVGSYGGAEGGAFYVRGQGVSRPGSEICVYVDGAPREVGVWGHSLLDIVNVAHAESLKVYKSPQPQLYGGVFGAVEMETLRRENSGFETGVRLSAGSFDSYSANVNHGGKSGGFDYYAGYAFAESGGHRTHSAGRMKSGFARLGYDLASEWHLAYIFSTSDNYAEDPGRADGPVPVNDRYETRTYDNVLRLEHHGDSGMGYVTGYYEDGRVRWKKDRLAGPKSPPGSSNTDWENYGLRSSHSFDFNNWQLTGGFDWNSSGGEFENIAQSGKRVFGYDERFDVVSPAVAIRRDIDWKGVGRLGPSVGVRWYDNSEFGSETAPHAGVTLDAGKWEMHAAYARGVHYPGVYAAGVSASTLETISAEVMDHYEAGVAFDPAELIHIRLCVFRDDSKDLLVSTANGLMNVGDGVVEGVECGVDYIPVDWARMYFGFTFMDASPDNYPRVPDFSLVWGVNIRPARHWELNIDAQYVGSQVVGNRRIPEDTWQMFEEVGGYLLGNAKLNYDIIDRDDMRVRIFAAIENFTDTDYEYWPGYPMSGISYVLGVESGF